ncbi:MAG: helix-turn-helix domain-containing protein [Pacificimonas sp.]
MSFGQTLAALRRARGWSQETLALRAGLSQRHISFLETGRSQPGSRSLRNLTRAMALKGWEHRSLLATISYGEIKDVSPAHESAFIRDLLKRMTIWPAYAFEPDGSLVAMNDLMKRLIKWASPNEDLWQTTSSPDGPNIYDFVFHPRGLCRWLRNPETVLSETLRRLRVEASHLPELGAAVERVQAYPSIRQLKTEDIAPPSMLVEEYQINGQRIAIVSLLSHLASSGEVTLDRLRFESFVPIDCDSERLLRNV